MRSRLLERLESRISETAYGIEREILIAERVAYLARAGEVESARQDLAALRQNTTNSSNARLSAVLNIAEGLCHYYQDMSPIAQDRFNRAQVIARFGGHNDLAGRAASWLGLLHYGSYRFEEMTQCLNESLSPILLGDPQTLARSSMTVALTIHLANQFDKALPWYRRSHILAAETEDEAMISAVLHNMASVWTTNIRNSQLGGISTSDNSKQAFVGAVSTSSFDNLVGLSALSAFTPLMEAQLHSLQSNYEYALRLYEENLPKLNIRAVGGWQAWLVADSCWCRMQIGKIDDAKSALASIQSSVEIDHHIDDRAATMTRLAQGWRRSGEIDRANSCEAVANRCWEEFNQLQQEMLTGVTSCQGFKWMNSQYPL